MGEVRSRDGTAIAFDKWGEGPILVIVGGALQHRAIDATTARLAALLASRFSVIGYDRRGRGSSGDTPPYAVEREVEDLEALIAASGGSAYVYGMSSGAALALEGAARGIGIEKLAVYEPPFIVGGPNGPWPNRLARQLGELAASDRRGEAIELFLTHGPGSPAAVVAQLRSAPIWPALEEVAHTLAYDASILCGQESLLTKRVPGITVPTLVIEGGASPGWAHRAVQALSSALPNARRRTLEGQTHDVAPDALAPVLEAFFR